MADLLGVIRTAKVLTNRVLVSYSGGKDSAVTLDLCARHFDEVQAFFMYFVPGLSFQERILRWAEARYGIEIIRIPHFDCAMFLRGGTWADPDPEVAAVKIADVYGYMRERTGLHWIAAGERIADSIVRRAYITKRGTIDPQRGRIYPLAHWRKRDVTAYLRRNALRVSEESALFGWSFRDLMPRTLALVKQHYPEDFERILRHYPQAEVGVAWWEMYGREREAARQRAKRGDRGRG